MPFSGFFRILLRAAIIAGLIVGGWTPAAMATSRISDCAMMAQSETAADQSDSADTRASCPFAAFCAVASVFVAPQTVMVDTITYEAAELADRSDDRARPEFQPSPPARPPRF